MNSHSKSGQVGLIMVMLIFGLLMTVSMAYMKMVQTEIEVQNMSDHTDRAVDAAFSGVNYAIALSQTNRNTFINSTAAVASRTYVIHSTASDWTGINSYWTSTRRNQVASVPSDWLFLNESLTNYFVNETTASPPYHFRVTSYPAASSTAYTDPQKFLIKSQGRFLNYTDDRKTVLATFTAQLIAECEINFNRKLVQLRRYRFMPFENDNNKFFKATTY